MVYNGSIYFEITDHKGYVGSLMWCDTTDYVPYCGDRFTTAMYWIDKVLFNYNRNLLADEDIMPREIFCLRLMECIDWYGRMAALVPVRSFDTEAIITRYKSSKSLYEFNHGIDRRLKLTINKPESDKMKNLTDLHVDVNFVTKSIQLHSFCRRVKPDVYSKIKGVDIPNIHSYKESLMEYPNWITNLSFNRIDEASELVAINTKGFSSAVDADIILVK